MKAKSTIQAQIRRLRRMAEDTNNGTREFRGRCYDAYNALRWVIEDTDWTPAGLAEQELSEGVGGR